MNVTGVITNIKDTEVISDKFKKREVWIQTLEEYPQDLSIQFVQDKVDILDKYDIDQQVDISVNLRGRKWTNKEGKDMVFNTIEGWRIQAIEKPEGVAEGDDLPF